MKSVACIGDIGLDVYVDVPLTKIGGISFNVAWTLRQHEVDAHVFSLIGNDREGRALVQTLEHRHIPTQGLVRRDGSTAMQRIVINAEGERVFDGYRAGVLSDFACSDLPRSRLAHFDALHVPLSDGLENLFESVALEIDGITKIGDFSIDGPNPGGLLASVERYARYFDLLCVGGRSEDARNIASLARVHREKVFVVTLGSKGVVSFRGDDVYEQGARPVSTVVDTTGCGDGFQGAFIAQWLADRGDIPKALHAGVMRGAQVASFLGANECGFDEI